MTLPKTKPAKEVGLGEQISVAGKTGTASFKVGWRQERPDGIILLAERAPLADSEEHAVGAECAPDAEVIVG